MAYDVCIPYRRQGRISSEIRNSTRANFCPKLTFKLNEIRDSYEYDANCPSSVPQALEAFFEATSFEDAIRNAVSIGGDVDTTAAIAASIAEAEWGIHDDMIKTSISYIDRDLVRIVMAISDFVIPHQINVVYADKEPADMCACYVFGHEIER